jgi:hypothetical protein
MGKEAQGTIDVLSASLKNSARKEAGKARQICYSPECMHLFMGIAAASPMALQLLGEVLPVPSLSTVHARRSGLRADCGPSLAPYLHARASLKAKNVDMVHGILMCDEVQVKQGLIINTRSGKLVGVAGIPMSVEGLYERLFSAQDAEDRGSLLAGQLFCKINQFIFRSIESPFLVFPLEHFSNSGDLDGNELYCQWLHVVHRAETCGLRTVHSQTDAGGGNPQLNVRIRTAPGSDRFNGGFVEDRFVSGPHPLVHGETISFSYCTGHGCKNMRGQLLGSGTDGECTRKLCNPGRHGTTCMVWDVITDKFNSKEENGSASSALTRASAFPKQFDLMSIPAAKAISHADTINALTGDALQILKLPVSSLTAPSAADRREHAFLAPPMPGQEEIGIRWHRVRQLFTHPELEEWPTVIRLME